MLKSQIVRLTEFLKGIFINGYLYTVNLDRNYIKVIIGFNKTCHDVLSGNTENDTFKILHIDDGEEQD